MEKLEKGTFYLSYYEAGSFLEEKERIKYYERIFQYLFYGKDEKGEGISEGLFYAIKPNIKCSRDCAISGAKGKGKSRNIGNDNACKKQYQNNTKTIPKQYKEKEKEKEKENIEENIIVQYYQNTEKKETFLWQTLDYFFKLGYVPAKDETVEGLADFFTKVFMDYKINIDTNSGHYTALSAMFRWYTYWKDSGKKIKNFKSTFSNSIQYSIK